MASSNNNNNEKNLPTPLITTEILTKLPVKSLLRFRCVSKPWKSSIDDPHFINLHLKNSIKTLTNHSLIFLKNSSLYSIDFPTLKTSSKIKNPFQDDTSLLAVLGSCNGLLCLIDQELEWDPLLYNPTTKQSMKVTFSKCEFDYSQMEEFMGYGFGYDHVNDDYKILRIVQFGIHSNQIYREIKVYSLKMNSWKKVKDISDKNEYFLAKKRDCGVYLNGCLHWMMGKNVGENNEIMLRLIAFDLVSLEWKFVSKANDGCRYFGGSWVTIGVLGGCLSTGCNYPMDRFEVWVMKEYGVEDSWTKICVVPDSMVRCCSERVLPIAYSKDCSKVLIVQEDLPHLFWFDLERKTVENVKVIRGVERSSVSGMVVESLVSLGSEEKKKSKMKSDKLDGFLSKGFKLKL